MSPRKAEIPSTAADVQPCSPNLGDKTIQYAASQSEKAVDGTLDDPEPVKIDERDEHDYPSVLRLVLLTMGIAVVVFCIALDNTIIATAIPTITSVFHSLDDVGWYGAAYLLTTTSLQPTFGKIYATFDVKWTYLTAIALFEAGSIICALANSSALFIVGRAIAGTGASGLFSGGLTIIGFSVPARKFTIYISVLSSIYGVASIVGPILGGALTAKASWRWCFWINLPFGAIAFAIVLCFFKPPKRTTDVIPTIEKIRSFDIFGTTLLICSIVCLLLALQWGGTTKPWSAPAVWGLLLAFALIFAAFCGIQWIRGDRATIPPRLFLHQRTTFSCTSYAFFLYMGQYTHIYFLPFYFQAGKGSTAEKSGIMSIPYLVSVSIFTILAGTAVAKIGFCVQLMALGAGLFTIGSGLLTTLRIDSSAGMWIGYQILAGIGVGIGSQLPYSALQSVLRPEDMPFGNAIVMFFITLGGAISIPISQAILTNALEMELSKYTTGVNASAIINGGATVLGETVPYGQLSDAREAYILSLKDVFILPVVSAGLAFIFSLLMERKVIRGEHTPKTSEVETAK
ncbi:hypothetical protein ACEPAG_5800 [Sanghuangporus baumii]